MDCFNRFIRDLPKPVKGELLARALELQDGYPEVLASLAVHSYERTHFSYSPNKPKNASPEKQAQGRIKIDAVKTAKGKINLRASTCLPVLAVLETKCNGETEHQLALLDRETSILRTIDDRLTTVASHVVPYSAAELVALLVELTAAAAEAPRQPAPLPLVPGHVAPPRPLRTKFCAADRRRHRPSRLQPFNKVLACIFAAVLLAGTEAPLRRLTKAERYEAVIERVAIGLDGVDSQRLPDESTLDDVRNCFAATVHQAMHDMFVATLDLTAEKAELLMNAWPRMDDVFLSVYVGEDPLLDKALPYVGSNKDSDYFELAKRYELLLSKIDGGPWERLGDALDAATYKGHDYVKQFCSWFALRWEGACKHRFHL